NVMFPAGPVDVPFTLSPTQVRVYQGSPIYKAYPSPTMKTRSRAPRGFAMPERVLRASGLPLSPVEHELSLGFCGLTPIDGAGMVERYGRDAAIAQLRAA